MTLMIQTVNGTTTHHNVPEVQVNRLITMYSDMVHYGKQYVDRVRITVVRDQ